MRRKKNQINYQKIEQDADKHMANNIYRTYPTYKIFVASGNVLFHTLGNTVEAFLFIVRMFTFSVIKPIAQRLLNTVNRLLRKQIV